MKERRKKVIKIIVILALAGAIGGIVMIKFNFYLPCPFRSVTGLLCPGCGATRMMLSIMQLDFKGALHYNPMLFITLPLIFFLIAAMSYNYIKENKMQVGKKTGKIVTILVIAFIAFGIGRNIY